MTDARAAVGMDRLPWLTDEPAPRAARRPRQSGGRDLLGWVFAAMLFVAGGSYWLGTQAGGSGQPAPARIEQAAKPSATVRLPEPRSSTPPEAAPTPPPAEVRPAPAPEIRISEPPVQRPVAKKAERPAPAKRIAAERPRAKSSQRRRAASSTAATRATAARPQHLALWPAREPNGAYGRLVQIGAFGSRHQAKLGWRRMVRSYPAVGRLPAVVVEARNSRGRRFYRFQIGTSSQAHSEVLCQRMQSIRFSCAVVGLPWKAKVER